MPVQVQPEAHPQPQAPGSDQVDIEAAPQEKEKGHELGQRAAQGWNGLWDKAQVAATLSLSAPDL